MRSLEEEIIARQSLEIGMLKTSVIELDIRLVQALATIALLEKELEKGATVDGDTSEKTE